MEKKESKVKAAFAKFVKNAKIFLKKQTLISASVYIIFFAALLGLIITPVHVEALYRIYSDISGFAMFCFVLSGLICMFCSTRLKKGVVSIIMTMFFLALTSVVGIWLISIYADAIANQLNIPAESVVWLKKAIIGSIALIVFYVTGFILLLCNLIKAAEKANTPQVSE